MRKCILRFYVFIATVIIGAVFIIGCGETGTSSGPADNHDKRICNWQQVWSKSECQGLISGGNCSSGGTWWSATGGCTGSDCDSCFGTAK
jgi:hypothetical protein